MKTTLIATSLNPGSKSQQLALNFKEILKSKNVDCEHFDLRKHPLPFAGPYEAWEDKNAEVLKVAIEASSHIIFAVPIYCYDVNAAAKTVIELLGRSFTNKIVSFICTAGGEGSYMSVMGMANHLMLDFRTVIVPRFVYAQKSDWSEEGELSKEIEERLLLLYDDMKAISVSD